MQAFRIFHDLISFPFGISTKYNDESESVYISQLPASRIPSLLAGSGCADSA
jgi:hypothetical protein